MARDDDLRPKPGRIHSTGSTRDRAYLHQVLRATALAGGVGKGGDHGSAFSGSRIGRGAGIGRMLVARDRHAAFRARRVVVKSRIVKLAGSGVNGARAHLRYIQRDGVTREGEPGKLYDAERDPADGKTFLDRAGGDRHQFRFIVAPEDGADYDDLKPLTRRLMAQMEQDLGTGLDWVAVDHFNTGHPHSHVIVRGKDEQERDLVIAREYLTEGLRERAAELVTLDLGPRTDLEIETRLRREVEQERFTSLDRNLLRDASDDGLVAARDRDAFRQTLRAGRLTKLRQLGLANEVEPGSWRLADELEPTLRRMGERGDILKTMQRTLAEKDVARAAPDIVIHDPTAPESRPVVGRVVARGLSDEVHDRHYLIVDGVDGRSHYVDVGRGDAIDPIPSDAIVRIEASKVQIRETDRTVLEVAVANGGRYSVDLHLQHDPAASVDFAETHVRRLEAIRRTTGDVDREPDGTWVIDPDHLNRAAAYERSRVRAAPVQVRTLSSLALEQQIVADGATWLDGELVASTPTPLRDAGFGREVRAALVTRRQWLAEQDLAHVDQDKVVYRANMLAVLRRRELARVAERLSGELGRSYAETKPGDRVEGILRKHVDLASGRFAVIEKSREFTLVPWRPVLEHHLGRQVSGIVRADTISWTIGRQRGGPSVG
jgi:type IV secretory pathway VirD2 relaxase